MAAVRLALFLFILYSVQHGGLYFLSSLPILSPVCVLSSAGLDRSLACGWVSFVQQRELELDAVLPHWSVQGGDQVKEVAGYGGGGPPFAGKGTGSGKASRGDVWLQGAWEGGVRRVPLD